MNVLLKFGIGADSSTFRLLRFAMPRYEMGVFKTGFAVSNKIRFCQIEKNTPHVSHSFKSLRATQPRILSKHFQKDNLSNKM